MRRELVGWWAYGIYRAATQAVGAALYLVVGWRRMRGKEHPTRWPERFGRPSVHRSLAGGSGGRRRHLLWFHAVSLGEAFSALPLIHYCLRLSSSPYQVLLTSTTLSSFEVIMDRLPDGVIYQLAPLDTPAAMENFLGHWKPRVILLLESELWPNLIISAARNGIAVALLNARMSCKSFKRWSKPLALPLVSLMLSKLSLIAPLSNEQAVRFQLLGAPPSVIHFAGDLKYAVGNFIETDREKEIIKDLKIQIGNRLVWMAASIHRGEEQVMLGAHTELTKIYPTLLLILVTRHPHDGRNIAFDLRREKVNVALRSKNEIISHSTSVYVVDTLGELRALYKVTPIAVIGGSFLPGLCGHNVSEAAATGCAILTGPHVGHFRHMLAEMQRINHLSVKQLVGETDLVETLKTLLADARVAEARQKAAKESFLIMSHGVVSSFWSLLTHFVLKKL